MDNPEQSDISHALAHKAWREAELLLIDSHKPTITEIRAEAIARLEQAIRITQSLYWREELIESEEVANG